LTPLLEAVTSFVSEALDAGSYLVKDVTRSKPRVVFSDDANPKVNQPTPGGDADRTVYYRAGNLGKGGRMAVDSSATLTLHEKMDPSSQDKDQHIADPPQAQEGEFQDYQYVPGGEQYRVLRDWKVGKQEAEIYDKQSGKAYRYEVTTLDANSKVAIETIYTNNAPF
jgi:hypothetical protein